MVEDGILKNFFGSEVCSEEKYSSNAPNASYGIATAQPAVFWDLEKEVSDLKEELENIKEEYNILYNSLNTIGEQLLKQIALNRILARENEILLEQKEAIWQSIQKK